MEGKLFDEDLDLFVRGEAGVLAISTKENIAVKTKLNFRELGVASMTE